jgi:hypothetical protein
VVVDAAQDLETELMEGLEDCGAATVVGGWVGGGSCIAATGVSFLIDLL